MWPRDIKDKETLLPMERRRVQLYLVTFLADIAILFGSLFLSALIAQRSLALYADFEIMQTTIVFFVVIAILNRVYSIKGLEHLSYAAMRVTFALLLSALLFFVLMFYVGDDAGALRPTYSLALLFSLVGMVCVRLLVRRYVRTRLGGLVRNTLIIEDGGPAIDMPGAIRKAAEPGIVARAAKDPRILDTLGRDMLLMDRVLVSCPIDKRGDWTNILRAAGVRGEIVSETLHILGALHLVRENANTFLIVSSGPLGLRSRIIKRGMDLMIGSLTLLLLSPLMLLVALLIKLEDGGPILFVQPRMGHGNRIFKMLKFRSMKLGTLDVEGARSTARDDERVTRIGRLIRATSVDELPQLINVLRSQMSLVGPRPHALGSLASERLYWEIDEDYWHRHALKPGMTGLAQIRGHRGATDTVEHLTDRLQSDLEYISDWSPWLDLKILVSTVSVLVPERA